jgi:HEAT repeat protein
VAPGAAPETDTRAEAGAAALAAWQECVAAAESRMGESSCMDSAAALASIGGPPLEQALSQLDDESTSPHGKVMIVEGFKGKLNTFAVTTLKAMTASDKDDTTRACATALLASIPDPELAGTLTELAADANPQVKFSALLGLASTTSDGSESRTQLAEMYFAPESSPNMKEHIVGVFSRTPSKSEARVLVDAVQNDAIQIDVRYDAAIALGRVGDETALAALEAIDPNAPTRFRDAVDLAIAAIRGRMESGMDGDILPMIVELPKPDAPAAP